MTKIVACPAVLYASMGQALHRLSPQFVRKAASINEKRQLVLQNTCFSVNELS